MSAVQSSDNSPTPTPNSGNDTPRSPRVAPPVSKSNTSSTNSSPTRRARQQQQTPYAKKLSYATPAMRKHEEFKNQLVHDVFGRDNKGRVPMEKVTMLFWQFRDDPAVVQFMAQFVARVRFVCAKNLTYDFGSAILVSLTLTLTLDIDIFIRTHSLSLSLSLSLSHLSFLP
jgi:hypothetical protein